MNIRLLTVGELRERHFVEACAEYAKRMRSYAPVTFDAIKPRSLRGDMSRAEERKLVAEEGEALLERLDTTHYNIALDSGGKQYSSVELAERLNTLLLTGQSSWTFVVGGPLGLARDVRNQAGMVWSLSRLTFPHELVPVLVLEQVYRSFKIMRGEPYHR